MVEKRSRRFSHSSRTFLKVFFVPWPSGMEIVDELNSSPIRIIKIWRFRGIRSHRNEFVPDENRSSRAHTAELCNLECCWTDFLCLILFEWLQTAVIPHSAEWRPFHSCIFFPQIWYFYCCQRAMEAVTFVMFRQSGNKMRPTELLDERENRRAGKKSRM